MSIGSAERRKSGEMAESEADLAQDAVTSFSEQAQVTLSNLAQFLYQVYCLPADYLSSMLSGHAVPILQMAGLPMDSADSLIPWLAAPVWIGTVLLAVVAWRFTHDLYITVRGYARRLHDAWKRIWRNAALRSSLEAQARGRGRSSVRIEPTITEEVNLGELEYAVLRCHLELAPGRTLTVTDIAETVGVSVRRAKEAFEILSMLQLIAASSMSKPGEKKHHLTPQGEVFLASCSGAPVDRLGKVEI
jgi:hypothetical protein